MIAEFEKAGYQVEPDVMDPKYTVVVSFPVSGHTIREESSVTLWEKMALAALLQEYWSDNSVSVTITFGQDEVTEIGPAIRAFEGKLKTLSFLPLSNDSYAQMPYESCDDETYQSMIQNISLMDRSILYSEKAEDAVGEKYCTNDVCELPLSVASAM
jgi:hypothetical protein